VKLWALKVGELESFIERDYAGCRVRARHRRVGEGGIAGADLELSGGDGGEQHEQRNERDSELRELGSGHWDLQSVGTTSCRVRRDLCGEKP